MSEPTVAALVVTRGLTPYLHRTVSSLLAQSRRPEMVIVVNTSNTVLKPIKGLEILNAPQVETFNEAITRAIEAYPVLDRVQWLWFLHDDSAPEQRCLEFLLDATKAGLTTAVVGPKHVAWSSEDRILEVGIKATRSGRRLSVESYDEIDQGQYDNLSDVLAVGTAGMLVDAQVWRESGGFDPHLTPFGEGLEFCRRVRLGGHRVVVVPQAKLAHARVSYRGLRNGQVADPDRSFKDRRFAQLYNGLILRNLPFFIASLILLPLWTLFRAGARLLQKRPELAFAELGAMTKLYGSLNALNNARLRNRNYAKVPVSVLKTLEATHFEVNRNQRLENRKERQDQPAAQLEPIAAALLKRHRAVSHGTFAAGAILALLGAWFYTRQFAAGISGGAWANLPADYGTLFWQAWSGWNLGGNGYVPPADTLLPALSLLTAPLAFFGVSPATQLEWFFRLAPALAWITMYWGARVITHRTTWRFVLAVLWAASPVMLLSWATGRVSTLLVAVFLPLFVRGWMHSLRQIVPLQIRGAFAEEVSLTDGERDYPYAALASLALLVIASAAPWTLVLLVPLLLLSAVFSRGRRAAQIMLAIPAVTFTLPVWLHVFASAGKSRWQVLYADTGRPLAHAQPNSWEVGFGLPQDNYSLTAPFADRLPEFLSAYSTFLWLLPGAVVFFGAVLGLFNLQRWTVRARLAFLVGILATAVGIFTSRVLVAEGGELIFGWAGIGITIALLAWMLAATGSIPNLVLVEPLHTYRSRRRREKAVKRRERAERKQAKETEELPETPTFVADEAEETGVNQALLTTSIPKVVPRELDLNATSLVERSAFRFQVITLAVVSVIALLPAFLWFPQAQQLSGQVSGAPEYLTPATTVEAQQSSRAARFLKLAVSETGVEVELWRGDGRQIADSTPWERMEKARLVASNRTGNHFNITENGTPAEAQLAKVVTELLTAPDTVNATQLLELGIDEIALETNSTLARERALLALDRVGALTRAGESGAGTLWRVRPAGVEPARVFLKSPQGKVTPLADPSQEAVALPQEIEADSLLVIAEPKHSGWVASLNGKALEPAENGWQQAFKLPAETGHVRITWYADWLPVWWFSAASALIGLFVGAIPVSGRGRRDVD
ncbi:MAG: glycosyltransferase [Actinomycetaceae bacterium]|nr:glycosyltransferase [Actinomycetaceae bacterium]